MTLERKDHFAVLTLDNPANRNALTNEVLEAITVAIAELQAEGEVRCVVLAGGEKVFASGADIRTLAAATPVELYYGRRSELWAELRRVRMPLVAAVSGFCLGGGCDVIVASRSARFGLPETRLGLIPGAGGTQLRGTADAKEGVAAFLEKREPRWRGE